MAAACYALLSVSPSVLGFCGHATHFVILAALGGILLLLKAIEKDRKFLFFCSGLLLGVGYVMKQAGRDFRSLRGPLFFENTIPPGHQMASTGRTARVLLISRRASFPYYLLAVVACRCVQHVLVLDCFICITIRQQQRLNVGILLFLFHI